jgi:hypothetical protein
VKLKGRKLHGFKERKGNLKGKESLEGFAGFIPGDPVTACGLTVGERGERFAGERRTLARGYRTGL